MFQNLVTRIKSNVAVTAIVASGLTGVAGVSAYTLTRPIKATTDNTVNQEQVAKDKQDQAKKDDSQDKKIDATQSQIAQNSSQIAQLQTQTSSISSSVSTVVEKVIVIEKQVASSSSVASSTPSTVIPSPVIPTPVTPPASSSSSSSSSVAPVDELRTEEIKKLLAEKKYLADRYYKNNIIYFRPGVNKIEFRSYKPDADSTVYSWWMCNKLGPMNPCMGDSIKTPQEVIDYLNTL